MRKVLPVLAILPLMTGGCISTATSIVKAPFQVAGKAVDWTTTSQEESDRNYGRKMRKRRPRRASSARNSPNAARRTRGAANAASTKATAQAIDAAARSSVVILTKVRTQSPMHRPRDPGSWVKPRMTGEGPAVRTPAQCRWPAPSRRRRRG